MPTKRPTDKEFETLRWRTAHGKQGCADLDAVPLALTQALLVVQRAQDEMATEAG